MRSVFSAVLGFVCLVNLVCKCNLRSFTSIARLLLPVLDMVLWFSKPFSRLTIPPTFALSTLLLQSRTANDYSNCFYSHFLILTILVVRCCVALSWLSPDPKCCPSKHSFVYTLIKSICNQIKNRVLNLDFPCRSVGLHKDFFSFFEWKILIDKMIKQCASFHVYTFSVLFGLLMMNAPPRPNLISNCIAFGNIFNFNKVSP